MKISVKNLGIIKNAEIEMKGITVLAGKNGTGKSTLGKMLYCMGRTFYCAEDKVQEEVERQLYLIIRNNSRQMLGRPKKAISRSNLSAMIDRYRESKEIILTEDMLDPDTGDHDRRALAERLREVLEIDSMEILTSIFNRSIQAEFGGKMNPINNPRRITQIHLEKDTNDIISVKMENGKAPVIQLDKALDRDAVLIDDPYILDTMAELAPVYHSFYRFSHRADLEEKLLYNADQNSVVGDILAEKAWAEIGSLIHEMSDGQIVRENGFHYQSPGLREPLGLESLSTGMKSILLLKTLLENGSLSHTGVIIFDEPEVHLHPEWQFRLARILVLLPKVLNIKVLLSTHSADFLSAVNYYVSQNGMEESARYYQMFKEGDYSTAKDVSGQLDRIYQDLTASFLQIAEKL